MNKPEQTEFAPYYGHYVSLVEDGDIIETLSSQADELRSLIGRLPEEMGKSAYAEDKWTIKEMLSHIIDGERIFSYRVLRVARGDETPIEGFDQDDYIENANANARPFAELLDEFDLQRRSNLLLVRNISDDDSRRMGTASQNPVSARALVYIMAGHVSHHANVLRERYLS
jgi:hypothetical protein